MMIRGASWRRLTPRTLRGRLIAGLVALLAIACAAVGLTAYIAVRNSVSKSLDAQLQTASAGWVYCMGGENDHSPANGPPQSGTDGSAPSHTTGSAGTSPQAGTDNGDSESSNADSTVCGGLGDGTFGARLKNGQFTSIGIVSVTREHGAPLIPVKLSAADKATLLRLPAQSTGQHGGHLTVYSKDLDSLGGDYRLTAARGDDGDILITGLPTHTIEATLSTVALTGFAVFGTVLVLAGVLGTLWVRLSLRPLRRVATTAAQVAELPLESGEVELPAGVPEADPDTEAGQVAASFNRMLGHVQAALARRAASEARLRRFAADASHELRTPLSAIRGYSELALRHPEPVPEAVTHALRRVQSESSRMSVLVDDLLLLARLDAGRPLARESVDISRLAIDATSDARVARHDHRWVLDLPDDPVQVTGDSLRLHQVLANLLSNAGRHTPAGSVVTVRLDRSAASNAAGHAQPDGEAGYVRRGDMPPAPCVELSVTDNGPGIPPELLPELFERFTRSDTARSHADGSTGLGLAIVDAVVAAHKGCITVTSRPGMTRFSIALPGLPESGKAAPARPRGARRVLHRGPQTSAPLGTRLITTGHRLQ
jgi:two-component system, OmpR family, sensor kinase